MNYARNFYDNEVIPQPDMKYCKYTKKMYHQIDGVWEAITDVKDVDIKAIKVTHDEHDELEDAKD